MNFSSERKVLLKPLRRKLVKWQQSLLDNPLSKDFNNFQWHLELAWGIILWNEGLAHDDFFSNGFSGNSYLTWSYLDLGHKLLMVAMDHALEFAKPRDTK
jgi:hypothetical protein